MTAMSWLPAVHACLADPPEEVASAAAGGRLERAALEAALAEVRDELAAGASRYSGPEEVEAEVRRRWARHVRKRRRPAMGPVINATGVVVHTNLGRAPLSPSAAEAASVAATRYVPLEYDLAEGRRGSRYSHAVGLLREATGAEDALVVNNNAAALLLAAHGLAAGRAIVLSRGELIEIGGGFRIHEIVARGGVRVVEVGATNKTHLADYAAALEEHEVGAIFKIHRSNFSVSGFVAEVGLASLVELGAEHGTPVVFDQGTGIVESFEAAPEEPTMRGAIEAGVDLVLASGDKLLGGPQAGIVCGRAAAVARLRSNPLLRALRVDKMTLAALEATLRSVLADPEAIPVRRMVGRASGELRQRVLAMREALSPGARAVARVAPHAGRAGGGTLPDVQLPGWALVIEGPSAAGLEEELRSGDPPIVARVADDAVWIDPRAMSVEEERVVLDRLELVLSGSGSKIRSSTGEGGE